MKKIALALFIAAFPFSFLLSQKKYWVMFKDKNGTPYSTSTPSAYLSAKSIARRTNQGIAINNSDLPVTPSYVAQVAAVPSTTVLYRSKWLNGVVVLTNSTSIAAINSFSFVASTGQVNRYKITLPVVNEVQPDPGTANKMANTQSGYNYGPSRWQATMVGADCMHSYGYRGQGMTIAVMDIGFYAANSNPVFDSLFTEHRLLGTRDFVNGDTLVFEDGSEVHGAEVLSTMAGNKPGLIIGTAPKAKYWLLKTEDGYSETISEEYNWIRGAEFADSVGADICTTSLGYNQFDLGANDHVYADLTGRKAPMSIAANMAARKGMIVLNAAGNEGQGSWHYICVPADADSIITVGAVDSTSAHAGFSSYGPTADGRIKPDLCARGEQAYVCTPNGVGFYGNGTSFATPIMAGAVACLWQHRKFATNMQIIQALKATATFSANPNNSVGWGVPNMCLATGSSYVGVQQISEAEDGAIMFPNPCQDELNIRFAEKKNRIVRIQDVLGREVYHETFSDAADLSIKQVAQFNPGVYTISISSAGTSLVKKFVKQ